MAGNNPSYMVSPLSAGIMPSRFVKMAAIDPIGNPTPGYEFIDTATAGGAGGKIVGISFEGPVNPPGYIAALGGIDPGYAGIPGRHMSRVYGDGEQCALEIGVPTGVVPGAWVQPDSVGRGIVGLNATFPGALVLEGVSGSGQMARVQVMLNPN